MRASVEVLAWTVAGVLVWLATLSTIGPADVALAVACSLLCGLAAWQGRRATGGHWRAQLRWWRLPFVVLAALAVDTPRTLRLPWRVLRGRAEPGRLERFALPGEAEVLAASRRAVAATTMSATPSSIVLDADPETGHVLLHVVEPEVVPLRREVSG
ncbi:MAG: Na+/H+ antiporter subunit E [Motilibacteraceae bacterium]